ncbi:MAG: major capsid protein [Fretibacterium sp.]|nr:major capsid protein [Fretibacterium sp.]
MQDYYEPKTLRGVIKKTLPLRTFFKTRFFNNPVTFPTETVSFEFQEGKRRLAPFVDSRGGSESIMRDGYEVKTYQTPLIAPNRTITNDTLMQKLFGEMPYNSGLTPEERAAKIAAQDILDLQDTIWRREEQMCARVKQDGKLIIKGRGVNQTVDYGFNNIVTLAAAKRWTPTFDILGQLSEFADELHKDGVNPNMLILGQDAAKALLDNEKVYKLLDNRRVEIGEIRPAELENGVNYLGHLASIGVSLDLYVYNEWIPDETDLDANGEPKLKPIVDPETVIMQNSKEQNSMLYGAVSLIGKEGDFVTYMEEYVPYSWFTQDPPQKFLSIRSRPLPMPHDLKSWIVLKGVVTGG